ncbi:MAG: hypothetical protein AVDCRST_MAG55-1081 [uncultured Rubrobacteraceae bacterium]|uniref:Uncharacterized protein n=1 Tax=uncultured Rubrobacteraceae bacterium TaxID=349277 RepID=A0A6J4PDP8_9ACTN|nr:MAG: hypothetical protein AVDCRST_MAG55-1081 [uncultured Rubrobacteraceae bacterium]
MAFTFFHSPCGCDVIEARLGIGLLLGWPTAWVDARIFAARRARALRAGRDPSCPRRRKT